MFKGLKTWKWSSALKAKGNAHEAYAAVLELGRLGTDEAVVGKHVGAVGEVLARAEADLEMQRPVVAKQAAGGDLTV